MHSLSLVTSLAIVLLTTWAALTCRVKTNSLEVLALGVLNISAMVGVIEALDRSSAVSYSQVMMRTGLATLGTIYFFRMEVLPRLVQLIRRYVCG